MSRSRPFLTDVPSGFVAWPTGPIASWVVVASLVGLIITVALCVPLGHAAVPAIALVCLAYGVGVAVALNARRARYRFDLEARTVTRGRRVIPFSEFGECLLVQFETSGGVNMQTTLRSRAIVLLAKSSSLVARSDPARETIVKILESPFPRPPEGVYVVTAALEAEWNLTEPAERIARALNVPLTVIR